MISFWGKITNQPKNKKKPTKSKKKSRLRKEIILLMLCSKISLHSFYFLGLLPSDFWVSVKFTSMPAVSIQHQGQCQKLQLWHPVKKWLRRESTEIDLQKIPGPWLFISTTKSWVDKCSVCYRQTFWTKGSHTIA